MTIPTIEQLFTIADELKEIRCISHDWLVPDDCFFETDDEGELLPQVMVLIERRDSVEAWVPAFEAFVFGTDESKRGFVKVLDSDGEDLHAYTQVYQLFVTSEPKPYEPTQSQD